MVRSERLPVLNQLSIPSNLVEAEGAVGAKFWSGAIQNVSSQLAAQGPGARALIVGYRPFGAAGPPAHMFNAVVDSGGAVRFWNPQAGAAQSRSDLVGNVDFLTEVSRELDRSQGTCRESIRENAEVRCCRTRC